MIRCPASCSEVRVAVRLGVAEGDWDGSGLADDGTGAEKVRGPAAERVALGGWGEADADAVEEDAVDALGGGDDDEQAATRAPIATRALQAQRRSLRSARVARGGKGNDRPPVQLGDSPGRTSAVTSRACTSVDASASAACAAAALSRGGGQSFPCRNRAPCFGRQFVCMRSARSGPWLRLPPAQTLNRMVGSRSHLSGRR
jgi:hypothetical protein